MPYARSKARPRLRTADTVSRLSGRIGSRGIRSCHRGHESSNGLYRQRRTVLSRWRAVPGPVSRLPASRECQPASGDEPATEPARSAGRRGSGVGCHADQASKLLLTSRLIYLAVVDEASTRVSIPASLLIRVRAISTYAASFSMPMACRPRRSATSDMVPLPENGSSTISPGFVR